MNALYDKNDLNTNLMRLLIGYMLCQDQKEMTHEEKGGIIASFNH